MDFSHSAKTTDYLDRLGAFMDRHVYPAEEELMQASLSQPAWTHDNSWTPIAKLDELKTLAKAEALWNLFLPDAAHGAGLSNLDYAPLCEMTGRSPFAPEIFNCSAPDTGNMELLARYGSPEHHETWLKPLLNGEIRSAFAMTEPAVASSDATNVEGSILRDGDHYVVNGRKWFASGIGDPRCKLIIFMGKSDPDAADRYTQQSMILIPRDSPGVKVVRMLPVFGFLDAPHGHGEVVFENVRVPAANLLVGEGKGFEIAQGRLGPGRIHHCMRTIGVAETAIEAMAKRLLSRVAFGKPLLDQQMIHCKLAELQIECNAARALLREAAEHYIAGDADATLLTSMAKFKVGQLGQTVPSACLQFWGGQGFMWDSPITRIFRDTRLCSIGGGANEVMLQIIAKDLGYHPATRSSARGG